MGPKHNTSYIQTTISEHTTIKHITMYELITKYTHSIEYND